jgi:hypothetical protein
MVGSLSDASPQLVCAVRGGEFEIIIADVIG